MTAGMRETRQHETVLGIFFALALASCQSDVRSVDRNIDELRVPARADFNRVSDAMQLHCGTLDCHGQIGRNMRLYGHYGLRLAATDNPLEAPTSKAEYDASYWSVVGLEPEAMSRVVQTQSNPDALSMIRKPRGIEKHKGGQLMTEGDDLDRCLVGWLTDAFDLTACNTVADAPRPELDGGP
jgi:hypothetical protein